MTFWVAGAAVGGAVISGVAANKAAKTGAGATDRASAAQMAMFDTSREDQMPWLQGGRRGINEIGFLLGLDANGFDKSLPSNATAEERAAYNANTRKLKADPRFGSLTRQFGTSDLESDPIYQERLRVGLPEGQNSIMRMMSARGGLESGATLKALSRFNQDYAGNEGGNAFNRFQTNRSNILNPLQSLAGVGQTSASQVGNQAVQTGRDVGSNIMSGGDARASGYVGTANAFTGAIGQGANAYQQNQLMNRMFPSSGGGNFNQSYGNFLSSNSGVMDQGLTPNDLYRGF